MNNNQNYQVSEETVKDELKYIRTVYDSNFKQAALVKNWCLTIWVAILVGIITTKIAQNEWSKLLLLGLPVLLFWILEAIYGSKLSLLIKHEIALEDRIAQELFAINDTSDIFAASSFQRINFCEKYITFLKAFFTFETISFFYLMLIIIVARIFVNVVPSKVI